MPVHLLTISAMSSSSTSSFSRRLCVTSALLLAELFELGVEPGQFAVLDLRGAVELALAGLVFGFEAQGLHLLLELGDAKGDRAMRSCCQRARRPLICSFSVERWRSISAMTGDAVGVGFVLEGGALDF